MMAKRRPRVGGGGDSAAADRVNRESVKVEEKGTAAPETAGETADATASSSTPRRKRGVKVNRKCLGVEVVKKGVYRLIWEDEHGVRRRENLHLDSAQSKIAILEQAALLISRDNAHRDERKRLEYLARLWRWKIEQVGHKDTGVFQI